MTGWTWDQVRDQLDLPRVYALREAWEDNPPLPIAMRVAAEALGVEFKGGKLTGNGGGQSAASADPQAIMAEIGQSAPVPYVAPQRGLRFSEGEAGPEPGLPE